MELTIQERILIDKVLNERGANKPCTGCDSNKYIVFSRVIQIDTSGNKIIHCAGVCCQNCGTIRTHALATLGLMHLIK